MSYEKLSKKEGIESFHFIGTVFISKNKELWANPFENRELRARCFLKVINEETMEIFFHLTNDEVAKKTELKKFPCKTYFFGAYNQVNVCQMRAFGELQLLSDATDIQKFKNELSTDLDARTNDTNVSSMYQVNTEQKQKALKTISETPGMFFKFIPKSYAYHVYERG